MPKKGKTTNKKVNPYYNPNYAAGYAVLQDPIGFERIGTAIQSHNLDLAKQIDSEAYKYRNQNTKNEEWETTKEKEAEKNNELEELIQERQNSVLGQLALSSTDVYGISGHQTDPQFTNLSFSLGQAAGHVQAHDMPNMPNDYGISDFLSDQWNSFFGEMNHLQAEDARGYQVRAANDKHLIEDFEKSLDYLDELESIDTRLEQLRSIPKDNLTKGQSENLDNELNQLIARKQFLSKEYNNLSGSRKQLLDIAPKTGAGATFDEVLSGNQLFNNDAWWNPAGRTTAIHDELNDARRYLYGIGRNGQTPQEMRKQLKLALDKYDELNDGWNKVIEENEKDAKEHKDRISSWFKGVEQNTEINFFDPYTHLFRMPGIMGGSASSYMKQIPAMAAGIVGGIAAGLATGGVGTIAALAAGGGTSFALQRGAGISENNAEVAIAAAERIKKRTGLTDKDINDILSGKMTDQAKLRKITENIKTVENLFNEDMAATTWDAAVDATLNTIPFGYISQLGKFVRGSEVLNKITTRPLIKKAIESSFGKDFAKGFRAGEVAGPLAAATSGLLNSTVGKGARVGLNKLKNFVISKSDDNIYGALAHDLWKEQSLFGRAATNLEPEALNAAKELIKGNRVKYAKDIAGRLIKSSISEGIEEGKQHVNAEAFKNGQLDEKLMSTFDIALTDMINGLTMGAHILGIPLNSIGLVDIKDKDLIQEIKGGMMGGWGHTAMINVLRESVPFIRQQKANEIVLQQVYADKLTSQANFKQYRNWVEKGLFRAGHNDVLAAFERLEQINENYKDINGSYGISPDLIEKSRQKYIQVLGIAQDPITRIEAQNAGISVRDWRDITSWKSNKDYHNFVAAKAVALDVYNEKKQKRDQARQNVINISKKIDVKDLDNQYAEELLNVLQSQEDEEYSEELDNGLIEDKDGHIFGRKESRSDALKRLTSIQLAEQQNTANMTKQIAMFAALLKYREQLESGLELQKDNPSARVRRGLKEQLSRVNNMIEQFKTTHEDFVRSFGIDIGNGFQINPNANQSINTLEDVENHLVFDQESHEELREAYLEHLKWQDEFESATLAYENLVGKPQRINENGQIVDITSGDVGWNPREDLNHFTTTKGNAKQVIEDISNMEKDDDDFESLIETVYKNNLKSERLKQENGWNDPQIDIYAPRPVYDANGNHIKVEYSEDGTRINRKLAENEVVDKNGFLYEYLDPKRKDPLKEALKPRLSRPQLDAAIRQSFVDTWNKTTGTVLPTTPEGLIEMRRKAMLEKAMLSSSTPPKDNRSDIAKRIESYYRTRNRLVPPSPPSAPPVSVEPKKSPQEAVLEMLDKKYEEDKKAVQRNKDGYNTTNQDYFILNEGKVLRMSRVHSVKPESYIHEDEIKEVDEIYNDLLQKETYDDIVDVMGKYVPDFQIKDGENIKINPKYEDVGVYLKYIQDNESLFFNNPTLESTNEYKTTLKHLAQSLVYKKRKESSSIRLGSIMDELLRNFFGTPVLYAQTSTEDGIINLYNSKNEYDGRTYKEMNFPYDNFKSLINQLRQQYRYYTEELHWELRALPFTWRANFKNVGWVAGETDLIGVDKEGGIHIIDFKTSKHTFGRRYITTSSKAIKLTQDYQSWLNQLSPDDFNDSNLPKSEKAKNILNAIKEESGNNRIQILLEKSSSSNPAQPISYRVIIATVDMPFVEKPNINYGQVISAYEDYTNQQTAYAMMINLETGGNVKSVEILPMFCKYDYELRYISNIDLQERKLLPFSKKMSDILNGVIDNTSQTISELYNMINQAYDELESRYNHLTEDTHDDVWQMLSDVAKLQLSDFITAIENIQIPQQSEDVLLLKSTLDEINELLDYYQQLLNSLNEDYTNEKAKLAQRQEVKQGSQRANQHVQGETPGQMVTQGRAQNKTRSIGNTSHTNLNYRQVESDESLEVATSASDFITNADFNVYLEGDKVYVDISYNGKTWNHIEVDTKYNGTFFPKGERLVNEIRRLQEQKTNGQRIVPIRATMNRTQGAIKVAKDKNGRETYIPVLNTDLFANEDLYDIEFSTSYNKIGYVDRKKRVVTFDTNGELKPIYTWKNENNASQEGSLIYLKHVRKDELNRDSIIPVGINKIKLTDNDAGFLVYLLQNPQLLDKDYYVKINDNVYNTHATGRQFANLIVPIIDDPAYLGRFISIFRDKSNQNRIRLITKEDFENNSIGYGYFDLNDANSLQNFINTLKSMSITDRHGVLYTRLGTDNNTNFPFAGLRRFFIENNNESEKIQTVQITQSLGFDIDDFKTVQSSSGVKRQGLNGFAYYLKHNMLTTGYVRMGSCNVEIQDVMLENNAPTISPSGVMSIPEPSADEFTKEEIINEDDISALFKKWDGKKPIKKRKRLSEEKARKHLYKILGDDVPLEFKEGFIKVMSGDAHVVGNCKADAIVLSDLAWNGVEYHEAFHRIFEMLLPEHKRDFIYKKVADRLGVNLYNKDGSENLQSFRQCAEYVADEYMNYMKWHIDIKIPYLTKIWNSVYHWARSWAHKNDKELYETFVEVNDGKYKNAKPSQKQVDRFIRMYKELHAEIHGINFDHIVNRPMYDKLRRSVVYCILRAQGVDKSGRNVQQIGKHIDKETFKAGIDILYKQGYDIIGQKENTIPTIGQLAMREIYEKFDNEILRDDIANDISIFSTDFIKVREKESIEDAQGDTKSVVGSSIGEHTRASYEFSRFDKTSSRVRFFFATIPDIVYGDPIEEIKNGKKQVKRSVKLALNEFGLPQYVPVNTMFNEILNVCHDVDSISELLNVLQTVGKEDPVYATVYTALNNANKKVYEIKDGVIVRNSDQEALISQLMNIIRSNKHNFDIVKTQESNNMFGQYTIKIIESGTEYNAGLYPKQWGQMLVNGGSPILHIGEDGTLQFNKNIKGSEFAFDKIAYLFSHAVENKQAENGAVYQDVGIKQWLDNYFSADPKQVYLKLKVNKSFSYYSNPNDPDQLEVVKDKIVQMLNMLGISFSTRELDYMLLHKYGFTDAKALYLMFNASSIEDSMTTFFQFLKDVSKNGKINRKVRIDGKEVELKNAYSKIAFIKHIGNWKYQYRHSHDQLTVLATGNNKFYEISDNNYATDVVRHINKRTEEFEELKQDVYNYFVDTENEDALGNYPTYGSLVLKEISDDPDAVVVLRNFIGFKTDKRSDEGSDYFEISEREDYVSKATILEKSGIIMPTLSDKKTWMYLDGIKLPGLDYTGTIDSKGNTIAFDINDIGDQFVITKDPKSQIENMLSQRQDVIDQFISYAISEYKSILKADADLDQMEKDGTKDTEVDNYYNKEQGARFSSLLGVWEYDYKKSKDGSMVISGETFHSFNNSKKTRKQNIKEAEKYFFSRDRETQERLIQRLLHKAFLKEVDRCVELGLIKKVKDSENIFENYENVGLNTLPLQVIYKSLVLKNNAPADAITTDKYKSLALMIYINDISNKAIMSGQEFERVFSGNPSFYKWKFDDNGNLIDRTVDELKRLGGVVSTGNNNFLELKDIPTKYIKDGKFTGTYVCAQVKNELIESPQILMLDRQIKYGELSTAVYLNYEQKEIAEFRERIDRIHKNLQKENPDPLSEEDRQFYNDNYGRLDEAEYEIRLKISEKVDNMTQEELESSLDESTKKIALKKAEAAINSYKLKYKKDGSIDDGIDVADGAAYITDTMAEMLLRMNGNYSSSIENAFKILREETRSTILEKQQAYQAVLTEVIGTQKYTAFGRRKHQKTGTLVTYYNKMAVFPMFQCMCTGKTQTIFQKMKSQGIDMLMVDSAVKVGGQSSKEINWDNYAKSSDIKDPSNHIENNLNNPLKPTFDESFEFGTYEQKFMYLRKQLNTDPDEDWVMNMGTQMTKIVMSNLLDGRSYYLQNGVKMSGKELRDDIMNIINELSNRGLRNIEKRFFKTNKNGDFVDKDGNVIDEQNGNKKVLDEVKFSKEIKRLLLSKDPDINILDALEIVEEKDGTKHMRLPLNAISNSKWLESNLISAINEKVIDIETSGAAFIQRSVWGMEGFAAYDKKKGEIIGDENLSPTINNGERLQMINEEGSMDCVVSADFIKKMLGGDLPRVPIKDKDRKVIWDLVPELDRNGNAKRDDNGKIIYAQRKDKNGKLMFDKNGKPVYKRRIRTREMTFDELRNWLIKRNIIGKGAKANVIGYRIPTQAHSSIHALRIVDIIPVVNDTVILPAEFTKITGSDFDIDKLFLSSIQYKVSREEGEDGNFHQIISDEFDEKNNIHYQNKLIRDYIALLLDWKSPGNSESRSTNIKHRSIDNDTELLKQIIRDLESGIVPETEDPYGFYTLSKQTRSKNEYITGKIGIGPFALNNNNHILTMMYHVKFKHIPSSIMSALDLESLDGRQDKDKESIMSWLSALINAHVDIAKDPYISRLNVNPFTYNLVNLLVRTGLGKKTFYFTTQPIMKHLAKAYVDAGSMYMSDPYQSKYKLQQQAIDKVAEDWFKDSNIKFEGRDAMQLIDVIKQGGIENSAIRSKINDKIKELFDKNLIDDAKGELNLENQFFYYLAYLQFTNYANALSNLVMYSKIDTKKHGKSVTEQIVYKEGFVKTFDTDRESSLFEPIGLQNMLHDSYIYTKTINAIDCVRDILGPQFIESTPAFLGSTKKILKAIGRTESLSSQLVLKISNALSAAIKSKFFNEEYIPSITNNPNFVHDLVSESTEFVDFKIYKKGNAVVVSGNRFYDLMSYRDKQIQLQYKGVDGKTYTINTTIIGANEETNTIYTEHQLVPMYGKAVLQNGRNTIYDRLLQLTSEIRTNPVYSDLVDQSGEFNNRLLQMLIPEKEVNYVSSYIVGEQPDTYAQMKFVKFFNFIEDSGSTSNYIIDAWDELLNYTNNDKKAEEKIRNFARDLIVYGFITSGDRGGFTKIFKYVPTSWREQSGYGNFIRKKLLEYQIGIETDVDIEDLLLNNWFDNELIPTYKEQDENKKPQFIKYITKQKNGIPYGFPTILAALKKDDSGKYIASINPDEAPLFIKTKRRKDKFSYDSQRRFTVYKLHKIAINKDGYRYPVYIKVNPKGAQVSGGFLITEYGRDDRTVRQEYEINEQILEKTYQATSVGNYINIVSKKEPIFASIIEGLSRTYNREQENSVENYTGVRDELRQSSQNNNFDDSEFSDDAMKHCKS